MSCSSTFTWRIGGWVWIDEYFCGLVDRLRATGYHRTLEVVEPRLREMEGCPGGYDFTKFMLKFREGRCDRRRRHLRLEGRHNNLNFVQI